MKFAYTYDDYQLFWRNIAIILFCHGGGEDTSRYVDTYTVCVPSGCGKIIQVHPYMSTL